MLPAKFALVLGQAAKAIRREAPESQIVLGGLSTGPEIASEYVRQVRKALKGRLPVDAVGLHPYGRWPQKHLESLKNAYSRTPYFTVHIDFLEALLSTKFEKLIDLNLNVIRYLMQQLKIETQVILLSELGIHSTGEKLLIEICGKMGASQFLTQSAAQKYLDADRFADAGIRLTKFKQPLLIYPQLWGSFIPNLSALDLIFNCGPKGHDIMIGD